MLKIILKTKKGFTLIELLIVISIIGLLTAVILVNLTESRDRAKNTKIKQELIQIRNSFELIRNSNGSYPTITAIPSGTSFIISTMPSTETINIRNQILLTNTGSTVQFIAYADATTPTKYALYASLAPVNSTYLCIDSSGKSTTGSASDLSTASNVEGGYCR